MTTTRPRVGRPCPHPHCRRLVVRGGYCALHQRIDRRPPASARGYDRDWARVARQFLAQFPWCGQRQDGALHAQHSLCVQRGTRVPAAVVDHIVPLPHGPRLDPANLQSLCVSCNTRKR